MRGKVGDQKQRQKKRQRKWIAKKDGAVMCMVYLPIHHKRRLQKKEVGDHCSNLIP